MLCLVMLVAPSLLDIQGALANDTVDFVKEFNFYLLPF